MSFLGFSGNFDRLQDTGQGKVPTVGISLPFLFLRNAREIYESLIIGREVRLDTPLFGDFGDFGHLVVLCPGGSELRPWRSQEVRGSLELQNGGLRGLEEAWDDFLLEAFSCQVWSFSVLLRRVQVAPGGHELRPRRSLEVRGSLKLQNGGLIALEKAWDNFLLEAFSCQVWSFSVLLGHL